MSLKPSPIPPVPDETARVARAAFPTGNPYLTLRDALEQSGCDKIFEEVVSGAKTPRAVLDAALDYLRAGDTLVVWRLDRLGRNLAVEQEGWRSP